MTNLIKRLIATVYGLFIFEWYGRLKELATKRNMAIYIAVNVVLSSEVWVPYLLAIIFRNATLARIASACWLFWLGPGTPFTVIAFGTTLGIIALLDRRKPRQLNIEVWTVG